MVSEAVKKSLICDVIREININMANILMNKYRTEIIYYGEEHKALPLAGILGKLRGFPFPLEPESL